MPKQLSILFMCSLFFSCTKERIAIPASVSYSKEYATVIADTIINDVWDLKGKELTFNQDHDYMIHGTGTIQNFILNASQTRVIFGTSINLKNIKTLDGIFSTKWYGIDSKIDNSDIIQKSVNIAKENRLQCFTPGNGSYKFSKTIDFSTKVNGKYQQSFNDFEGDASYWDNGAGTTFIYTGKDSTSPAFSLQLQKGSKFKNFSLQGLWKSPAGVDSVYFRIPEANYNDISGNNLSDNYTGIGIDYFYDASRSGSTGIEFNNVSIGGFGVAFGFSQNGWTQNNEAHSFDYIHLLGNTKYGFLETSAQEKGTSINHIYSWGSIYNIINIGLHGAKQAGNYSYNTANIAGRCVQLVNASIGHWFSSSFRNWYSESIGSVINFSGQMPFTFSNCNFNLNYNYDKKRVVINSNTSYLAFNNCTLRYYDGLASNVYVHGYMTLPGAPNNYFGGGDLIFK